MKFRILEQRGKYRIAAFDSTLGNKLIDTTTTEAKTSLFCKKVNVTEKYHAEGKWMSVWVTDGKPRLVNEVGESVYNSLFGEVRYTRGLGFMVSSDEVTQNEVAEFDSYEEAENYISEEWGKEGWRNIEKPEWRQV